MPVSHFTELEASVLTPTPFVDGRIDFLFKEGISALAWGPLGGDPLAGANRLFKLAGEKQARIRTALQNVAAEIGPGTLCFPYPFFSSSIVDP